jgi:hypothetical protein
MGLFLCFLSSSIVISMQLMEAEFEFHIEIERHKLFRKRK